MLPELQHQDFSSSPEKWAEARLFFQVQHDPDKQSESLFAMPGWHAVIEHMLHKFIVHPSKTKSNPKPCQHPLLHLAVSTIFCLFLVGVLMIRALLLRVFIRARLRGRRGPRHAAGCSILQWPMLDRSHSSLGQRGQRSRRCVFQMAGCQNYGPFLGP